jgi:hypothetical protein
VKETTGGVVTIGPLAFEGDEDNQPLTASFSNPSLVVGEAMKDGSHQTRSVLSLFALNCLPSTNLTTSLPPNQVRRLRAA